MADEIREYIECLKGQRRAKQILGFGLKGNEPLNREAVRKWDDAIGKAAITLNRLLDDAEKAGVRVDIKIMPDRKLWWWCHE